MKFLLLLLCLTFAAANLFELKDCGAAGGSILKRLCAIYQQGEDGDASNLLRMRQRRDQGYIRFGRSMPISYMRFGRKKREAADEKRYMRFGRGNEKDDKDEIDISKKYMRFGKRFQDDLQKKYMRFGKRYMRFGRGGSGNEEEKRYMRFGRNGLQPNEESIENLDKKYMRFGKRSSSTTN